MKLFGMPLCLLWSAMMLATARAEELLVTSDRDGNADIFLVDLATGKSRNLTNDRAADRCPSWSWDGERILFCSDRDGASNVYQMDADGTNVRQLTRGRSECRYPAFAPDGKTFAYCEYAGDPWPIRIVARFGGTDSRILALGENDDDGFDPSWSPDGRHLAIAGWRGSPTWGVFVMNHDGSDVRKVFASPHNRFGNVYPTWSPDGRRIAFGDSDEEGSHLFVIDADGSHPRQLTKGEDREMMPSWSGDGTRIAYRATRKDGANFVRIVEVETGQISRVETPSLGRPIDGDRVSWRPARGKGR